MKARKIRRKEIHHTVLFDEEDFLEIGHLQIFITKAGYAMFRFPGSKKAEYVHRHIMGLTKGDGRVVDHINFNRLDNRKENLRVVTMKQNTMKQRKRSKPTSSIYKGVYLDKRLNKWVAAIGKSPNKKHLGVFLFEEDAARAYNEAAVRIHGEFAVLNEVKS